MASKSDAADSAKRMEIRGIPLSCAQARLDLRQGKLPASLKIRKPRYHGSHNGPLIFRRFVVGNRLNHSHSPLESTRNGESVFVGKLTGHTMLKLWTTTEWVTR